jgi:hypothetical protein
VVDPGKAVVVTDLVHTDLLAGATVEVFNGFLGHWVSGFVVVQPSGYGYRIRRMSDRAVLPGDFAPTAVRSVVRDPVSPLCLPQLDARSATRTRAG